MNHFWQISNHERRRALRFIATMRRERSRGRCDDLFLEDDWEFKGMDMVIKLTRLLYWWRTRYPLWSFCVLKFTGFKFWE